MTRRVGFALSMAIAVIFTAVGVQAESHVRIVRLSYTDGQVQMDRAGGPGLERAILNAPIVEGTRLVTGSGGLAEVEFENRSTLRLAENSEVQFTRLLMNDSGVKVNEVQVLRGIVYMDVPKSDDIYRVTSGQTTFVVRKSTELRMTAEDGRLRLAVFKGEVQVENQPQPLNVKKKETLIAGTGNPPLVTPGVDSASFDAWNSERSAYTSAYTQSTTTFGGPPVAGYGLQDLNYYGAFFNAPGYGYAWQPYGLAGMVGWNPYMAGAWMFDGGLGYSFASAYPWGWLPYHYGSWAYLPNAGWAWLPGNGSNYKGNGVVTAFQPTPVISKPPAGFIAPVPAVAAQHQTLLVGTNGTPAVIPGGRVPPNFASVVPANVPRSSSTVKAQPGSTFSANSPNASTKAGAPLAQSNTIHPASGHVFVQPTAVGSRSSSDAGLWEPSAGHLGGAAPGMAGTSGPHMGSGSSKAGHSSGGTVQH